MATNEQNISRQDMTEEELQAMLEAEEGATATADVGGEDDEDEVVETEPGVTTKKVTTTNERFGEIKVEVRIPLAPSVSDYAGEDFYGSEEAVKKALDADWARRKANSARPVLRDAERELDWQQVAQQTADQYKPGRRGGFAPSINRDELSGATSIDDVIALLQQKGVQIV